MTVLISLLALGSFFAVDGNEHSKLYAIVDYMNRLRPHMKDAV